MADRFDKFTERARKTLTIARVEARMLRHNYIGQEHILLALIHPEVGGVAAKVLANLGAEPAKIRSAIEMIVGHGDQPVQGEIGLTPRAKKMLEKAVDEARGLNHHYIGTEHLLLGMICEGEGVGAGVLLSLGVSLERAREETTRVISAGPPPGERPASAGGPDEPLSTEPLPSWVEGGNGLKRYNLVLPEELFRELQALADRRYTTVVELIRRFIKLGLLAADLEDRPDAALIIREGDRERQILLL